MALYGLDKKKIGYSFSGFELCSEVCSSHWFRFQEQKSANQKAFTTAVRKEASLFFERKGVGSIGPVKQFFKRKIAFILLPLNLNMCFGYPQHMFWMRNKENGFALRTFIRRPEFHVSLHVIYFNLQSFT